jgi:hypothetical protein
MGECCIVSFFSTCFVFLFCSDRRSGLLVPGSREHLANIMNALLVLLTWSQFIDCWRGFIYTNPVVKHERCTLVCSVLVAVRLWSEVATLSSTLGRSTFAVNSPSVSRPVAGARCDMLDADLFMVMRDALGFPFCLVFLVVTIDRRGLFGAVRGRVSARLVVWRGTRGRWTGVGLCGGRTKVRPPSVFGSFPGARPHFAVLSAGFRAVRQYVKPSDPGFVPKSVLIEYGRALSVAVRV